MYIRNRIFSAAFLCCSLTLSAQYQTGVFFVNEDFFGHNNSTMNYLEPSDGSWHYKVFQKENPGHQLGQTSQDASIHNGRMYIVSKQAIGADGAVGSRIAVVDAASLHVIKEIEDIVPGAPMCDGRGFIAINNDKAYVSTSDGVFPFSLVDNTLSTRIVGTENPYISGEATGSAPLYSGQSGKMAYSNGKLFLAHQSKGLLVIDAEKDAVISTISMDIVEPGAGIGSVVEARDGSLWLSVQSNQTQNGNPVHKLVYVNPLTLESEVVDLPEGVFGPSTSWYAWTPDAFCASKQTNTLYWRGGESRWYADTKIFSFDVDTRTARLFTDLDAEEGNWHVYGASMRMHPVTDKLYMTLFHEVADREYIVRAYNADGSVNAEYPMEPGYWFPSLPVFADYDPAHSAISEIEIPSNGELKVSKGGVIAENLVGEILYVYNTSGHEIWRKQILCDSEQITLSLPAGLYLIKAGKETLKIAL